MAFKSKNITYLAVESHQDFSFAVLMGIKYQWGPMKSVSCLVKLSQCLFGYKIYFRSICAFCKLLFWLKI